jgi:two-component system, chemotaxis family, protein-glutamate methylesterase/glutaminase
VEGRELRAEAAPLHRLVVVASSAGGVPALLAVLPRLPTTFAAPVVCVQHVSPHLPTLLVEILERRCILRVAFVEQGSLPAAGTVLVAPPDRHAVIESDGRMSLWDGPRVNHVRPSADLLFSSAAEVAGAEVIAVVLSGTGHDGAAGAAAVQQRGGVVMVQSPESCEFPGMVDATTRLLEPDVVAPLDELAAALIRVVGQVAA